MPIFTLPDFNLLADGWTYPATPAVIAADVVGVPCQKYINSRLSLDAATNWFSARNPPLLLRFPRVPPYDGPWPTWPPLLWEVPSGSGQYYVPYFGEIMHEGFPNEYAQVWAHQSDDAGHNIPPDNSVNYSHNPTVYP